MNITQIRQKIIDRHKELNLAHCASSLSCADIFYVLYSYILGGKDKVILSKGHAKVAWDVVRELSGLKPIEADNSLGNGLGIGCGMVLANKKVFVILSDGELNEGSTWEAIMFAGHHRLGELTAIVDYNGWQANGRTKDILDLSPIAHKWSVFGWNAFMIDGHDVEKLTFALRIPSIRPKVIIARTVKGKGLVGGEDSNKYHYEVPI